MWKDGVRDKGVCFCVRGLVSEPCRWFNSPWLLPMFSRRDFEVSLAFCNIFIFFTLLSYICLFGLVSFLLFIRSRRILKVYKKKMFQLSLRLLIKQIPKNFYFTLLRLLLFLRHKHNAIIRHIGKMDGASRCNVS